MKLSLQLKIKAIRMPLATYEAAKKIEGINYNADTDLMIFGTSKVVLDETIDDITVDYDHSVEEVND